VPKIPTRQDPQAYNSAGLPFSTLWRTDLRRSAPACASAERSRTSNRPSPDGRYSTSSSPRPSPRGRGWSDMSDRVRGAPPPLYPLLSKEENYLEKSPPDSGGGRGGQPWAIRQMTDVPGGALLRPHKPLTAGWHIRYGSAIAAKFGAQSRLRRSDLRRSAPAGVVRVSVEAPSKEEETTYSLPQNCRVGGNSFRNSSTTGLIFLFISSTFHLISSADLRVVTWERNWDMSS
jgi:hypothetical protein